MQLVEAGGVDLDAPITTYLRDFAVDDPRGSRITVRHVLTHTSGLSDTGFHEKSGPVPASLEEGVRMLRQARLVSDPGSARHYHNPNYWIAARVVEVVSGERFDGVSAAPRLRAARHDLDADRRPSGSARRGRSRLHPRVHQAGRRPEPAWFLDGASGIVSTAHDMARWLVVQADDGEGLSGRRRVISRQSLDRMHAGLGWTPGTLGTLATFEHPGWMFTYTAHQVLVPSQGYGIAVMANVGWASRRSTARSSRTASSRCSTHVCRSPTAGRRDRRRRVRGAHAAPRGGGDVGGCPRSRWAARRSSSSIGRQALGIVPWFLPLLLLAALRADPAGRLRRPRRQLRPDVLRRAVARSSAWWWRHSSGSASSAVRLRALEQAPARRLVDNPPRTPMRTDDMISGIEALDRLREGNARFVANESRAERCGRSGPARRAGGRARSRSRSCSGARTRACRRSWCSTRASAICSSFASPATSSRRRRSAASSSPPTRYGTPLVVVMGHSQCGAILATLEEMTGGTAERSGNLRSIVDRVRPVGGDA